MPRRSKRSSKKRSAIVVKKVDWYGFDHDAVAKRFEGGLKFVNYMNVGNDRVVAVYRAAKPNRAKKHKRFMLLSVTAETLGMRTALVSGMELAEIKKHATVGGILCLSCNTALYSLNRHHYHTCECHNSAMVDGGVDYLRFGAMDMKNVKEVRINLLNDKVDTVRRRS